MSTQQKSLNTMSAKEYNAILKMVKKDVRCTKNPTILGNVK